MRQRIKKTGQQVNLFGNTRFSQRILTAAVQCRCGHHSFQKGICFLSSGQKETQGQAGARVVGAVSVLLPWLRMPASPKRALPINGEVGAASERGYSVRHIVCHLQWRLAQDTPDRVPGQCRRFFRQKSAATRCRLSLVLARRCRRFRRARQIGLKEYLTTRSTR